MEAWTGLSWLRIGIILKWIFSWWYGGMDWIDLAQNRDRWKELVSSVMNLRVA
jgi:hypothetical protein